MTACADTALPTATELLAALATGETSPQEVTRLCLARISRLESEIRAWKTLDPEAALAQAEVLEAAPVAGPLHGIPVGIKDVIDTFDLPTGYGSDFYEGFRPAWDAGCVARLRRAGAVILGKTVTTEFASVAPPVTRNPHNTAHTPGGSSSGSAAAVAAGMVPVALGTQTAGSVIRPAAYCGVVGYKPGFGLIERCGVKTLAQSFDTVGTFARSVADVALVTSVLAGRPALGALTAQKPKAALFLPPWAAGGEPGAIAVVRHAAALLSEGDASAPIEIAEIAGFDGLLQAQEQVMDWDMTEALSFELDTGEEKLHPVTVAALRQRRARSRVEALDQGRAHLAATKAALLAQMDQAGVDLLLVPAAPGEAPEGHHSTGSSDFNRGWTSLGVPCLVLPAGRGPRGLPLGVQLIARPGADAALLEGALWLEARLAAAPWTGAAA